jgi:Leucine-rich repeat (LRR) protein
LLCSPTDENRLCYFQPAAPLVSLQTLKVSNNRLRRLDVRGFPQLRTLYADGNELESINPTGGPTRLQTLSARSQAGTALVVTGRELRHVKRLFLSGNALSPSLFAQPCPELAYLELASCKLTSLPNAFATFAPALKSLNLNYNYLGDLSALADLRRRRKLSVVGSRLEASAPVVRLLQTLPALEMLDLRCVRSPRSRRHSRASLT